MEERNREDRIKEENRRGKKKKPEERKKRQEKIETEEEYIIQTEFLRQLPERRLS